MDGIKNANQLRRREFSKLIRKPSTWAWIGFLTALFTFSGYTLSLLYAGVGFVIGFLFGLITVWQDAYRNAARRFLDSYARARALTREKSHTLERCTPLLGKGDAQMADEILTGSLAEGFEGTLALYTYTEVSTGSEGGTDTKDYPFTLTLLDLPETNEHLPELIVQSKSGFKGLARSEGTFRNKYERVTLESEAMRDRYEVFVGTEQDAVWVRRLLSPSFIDWLADGPPKTFAFELIHGKLCCFVPKHRNNAEELDQLIAASCEVARRLRREAA